MDIIIRPNANAAAELVVGFIARELRARPEAVLGLATGRTMESVYRYLVQLYLESGLDFSRCRTFNLDEYVGLGPDHPNSYCHFMQERLFRHVNLDPSRTHLPNGAAENLETECRDYEQLIAGSGGIDLLLLGIGRNGHLGFNEPLSGFDSRTRVTALTEATREQNAHLFSMPEQVPRQAITMGIATILEARRCLLLATGKEKADIIAHAIAGPTTIRVTASVLQWHSDVTIVLDEAAASRLRELGYGIGDRFVQSAAIRRPVSTSVGSSTRRTDSYQTPSEPLTNLGRGL